jgi:hypothetical protein
VPTSPSLGEASKIKSGDDEKEDINAEMEDYQLEAAA